MSEKPVSGAFAFFSAIFGLLSHLPSFRGHAFEIFGLWAIEIKFGLTAKPERGFYNSLEDLQPKKAFVVYSGNDRYPLSDGIEAIGLHEMAEELARL